MARRSCKQTIAAFDVEQPRTAKTVSNRKVLCDRLKLLPLMQANSSRQKPYATMLEVIVHSMAFGSTALSTSPSAQTSTPSSTPASPTPTKVHQQKLEHRNSEQQAAMAVPESPKLKPRQAITAVTELVQKATKEEPPAAQTQTTSGTPTQVVSPRKEVTRATSGKLRRTPSHTLSPAHTPTLLTPVEEITATPIPPEMGTQTSAVKQTPLPEVAPKPPRPSSLPALQKRVSPLSAEISPDLTAFEHGKECTRKSVTFRKETLMLAKKKERKSNTTAPKSAFRKKKVHEMVEEKLGDKDARAEEEEIKKSEVEQRLEEEKVKAPEKENQREKEEKEKQAEEQKTEAHEAALAGVKEKTRGSNRDRRDGAAADYSDLWQCEGKQKADSLFSSTSALQPSEPFDCTTTTSWRTQESCIVSQLIPISRASRHATTSCHHWRAASQQSGACVRWTGTAPLCCCSECKNTY
eukprot:TRINITY_DN249_c1_g1_i4.p1 TRINITY_DN249_c1_g1~~TRINITY_DN249_c1_g1_i4.p1  ORF type:complete len:466 (+),score=87.03 TRINITY_DN249_c1_g1_i4:169-1566(+)